MMKKPNERKKEERQQVNTVSRSVSGRSAIGAAAGKAIVMLIVLAVLLAGLVFYNIRRLHSAQAIEAIDQLSGQKIAVCVGWESDYLLSEREDITLMRYDDLKDAVLALRYHQVDAVALGKVEGESIVRRSSGTELVGEPIAFVGYTLLGSVQSESVMNQFNEFLENFKKTPEYTDFIDRMNGAGDSFEMVDIPEITDGTVLRIDYATDAPPCEYINTETGEPEGYEIELVRRFACEYGYTIQFQECTSSTVFIDLIAGKADLCCANYSDVYREEVEAGGRVLMSEAYYDDEVLLLQVKPGETLKLYETDEAEAE